MNSIPKKDFSNINNSQPLLSIIVPCFNEIGTIGNVIKKLGNIM